MSRLGDWLSTAYVDLELALAVGLVLLLAWWLSWTASRLDRLHARVEGARYALEVQLQRRAAAAQQAATAGVLDPASSLLLAEAAHDARESEGAPDEQQRQSDLTGALVATFGAFDAGDLDGLDSVTRALLHELGVACLRVELARRFHNDAVQAALGMRRRRRVRWLRLAGRAPRPETYEMDDTVPPVLAAAIHASP